MTSSDNAQSYSAVSSMLWRERELLDLLLFKLTEERLILTDGATRWLAHANREVETVLGELRGIEVLRAAEVDHLAEGLGLLSAPTLSSIIDGSPEPWQTLLAEHRSALAGLVAEVRAITAENHQLLAAGARSVRETLMSLRAEAGTYDARGEAVTRTRGPLIVDEQA
ncbi:FlgN protein [Jatrophihabitans sp. GAS493]|uniref:flagellar export chaperone FlgN n=1 Tax=Jatrophihabitans sp. GAS493 TaxID=1907575 RepID=UPI000BB72A9F|nr:flagellar export chaperone FlgN [Jatrophihabitans sp. GAS493]SOD71349.1 FlgN protein [Jatrophihabitans sp. GAS493]